MARHTKTLLIATSCMGLLAGCAGMDNEAGASIDAGNFGNPTMNNMLVQTGQMDFAINLNRRFSEEVPSTVNFAFDSAVLDADARAALMTQANWIKQFPEVKFRVYGHTDLVGSDAYNKSLGRARANAVVNFLSSQGISKSRLEALVSFGETQPLVATEQEERRNRRTVTEVSGLVARHPTVLNGKYAQIIFREYVQSATEVPAEAGGLATIDAGGS
ncbi:MAG: OmpA family protein [Rhodobacteraceae bacterium]|nr:OmpA family protein [Paracoccaceae bacterium]